MPEGFSVQPFAQGLGNGRIIAVSAQGFVYVRRREEGDVLLLKDEDGVVSSANEFEIRSSELANQNAKRGDVKKAADMIIADHTKAGKTLKAILSAKDVAVEEPVKLAPKHEKILDQLKAAKSEEFDALYIDIQTQAHMEAIALFRTYAGSGDDQSIVGFAKRTLPSLETHMAHVKMLIAHE